MKALTAAERLKRAQEYIDKAKAMPEPTKPSEHGAWMKKQ